MAVYWLTDGIDSFQVGFALWHLAKDWDKFDCALAQVMEVLSVNDTSNHKRQKI